MNTRRWREPASNPDAGRVAQQCAEAGLMAGLVWAQSGACIYLAVVNLKI
ncbi:hypothetical protein [Nitrosospira briensis]|nr:hypothetical protein [Nitrosospira briensis]